MKKKKILLTLAIASMLGLAACGETPAPAPDPEPEPPVIVVDPVVTGITLKAEGDKTAMDIGTTLKFTATVTGEGDFNKQYTLSVDKEDIATISSEGVLTAKAEGSVVVTATATGDATKKSSITITVNEVAVCEIKDVVKDKRQHVVGEIAALTTRSFVIDDGTGAVLVFTKTAPEGYAIGDVVSVAGVVTDYHNNLQFPETSVIKKTESTIETKTIATPTAITGASFDEMAETITTLKPVSFWGTIYKEGDYLAVKVEDSSTHIIEPTDTPDSVGLTVGIAYNITGYLSPYYEKYSYNGLVITSATVKPIPVTSLTVNAAGGATSMGINETLQMSVTIAPEKATNKAVTWSVDKEDVATIDENGLLTSVAKGTVVVTATAKDGSGVTGTKSIEVLEFKDPVVSLTLGTAPTETVLGDGDIDVTVTVAGESSTSNFNPAYTPTSSDETVATVKATDTGIKISPVAAGSVTVTVKTTGTNADGEQLTKAINLTVLGEPKPVSLTIAEASSWRPTDPSQSKDYSNKLVELTGRITFYSNNVFLQDPQGHTVQIFTAYDKGTYAYDTTTKEYTLTPDSESVNIAPKSPSSAQTAARNALLGKTGTFKGILTWFVDNSGIPSIELKNCLYSGVSDEKVAATFEKTQTGEGSYDVSYTETTVYGESVSITNVTPADGYVVGSVLVEYGSHISRASSNAGNYSFTCKTYNKIIVNFVKAETFTASLSVTQVLARAAEDDMSRLFGRNAFSEYLKVTGVLVSIDGGNSYTIADPADSTKKISVFNCSALTDLKDANPGQLGIGYAVTVISQIQNYNGTIQLTNHVSASTDKGEIDGYTITPASAEHGTIESIKIGEDPVTGPVPAGTVVTVTLDPDDTYETDNVTADNSAVVTKVSTNVYTVKVFGDTTITPSFIKADADTFVCAFTATNSTTGNNSYTGTSVFSCGGIGLSCYGWTNNKGWDYIKAGKSGATSATNTTIKTTSAMTVAIAKITVDFEKVGYITAISLETATNAEFTEGVASTNYEVPTAKGAFDLAIASPAANLFYNIKISVQNTSSTNGSVQVNSITFVAA